MSQHVQRPTHHSSRSPEGPVGKQSLTAAFEGQVGAADVYESAIASAHREIAAVRNTALPAYVALRERLDLTPIALEIESTRIAMQVRHLLTSRSRPRPVTEPVVGTGGRRIGRQGGYLRTRAGRHVRVVESVRAQRDPIVRQLRESLEVQLARASELGVYRSAERERPARTRMARGTGAPTDTRPTTPTTPTKNVHATRRAAVLRLGLHL